jgi:hypothetical protein
MRRIFPLDSHSVTSETDRTDEVMKISCPLLAIGILYLMPLASMTQEVVPYANSEVKVDWVRGTDFSKYKTYAWGTPKQKAPDPNHPLDDIDAALKAEGLQKVGLHANPGLLVAFRVGNKQVYVIQHIAKIQLSNRTLSSSSSRIRN